MSGESFTRQIRPHIAAAARTVCSALLLVATLGRIASADVTLDLSLDRKQAYPGETVPVTVTLRISDARARNIGYPRLVSPAGGTVAFAPPVQGTDAGNPDVAQYRFSGRISSSKPGLFTVGPASLDLEIVEAAGGSAAFFGAVEPRPRSVVAAPAALTILPLPADGRPASFSGAIGTFTMNVTTKPEVIAAGDPFTVTTTISGTGNLDGASCPQVERNDLRSYPSTVKHREGSLVCEQVVVPAAAGALPPVVWSFFDPRQRLYRTARHQLPVVAVRRQLKADSSLAVTATAQPPAVPPTARGIPIPAWLTASFVLVATAYTVRVLGQRRQIDCRREPQASTSPQLTVVMALAEQALADGDVEKFYTCLHKIIQEITAYYYSIPAGSISSLPDRESPADAAELASVLANCDRVRYGRILLSPDQMNVDFHLIRMIIAENFSHPICPSKLYHDK